MFPRLLTCQICRIKLSIELNMSSWSMKNRLAAFFMHEITKIGDKKCRQMGKEICRYLLVRVI